jgi:hypothetical protein
MGIRNALAPILLFLALATAAGEAPRVPAPPDPADSASVAGLPAIGKWMIGVGGGIANWLGRPYRGRTLLEPINVIVYDPISKTEEEAYARLESAGVAVEFEMRDGHSTGYSARIGGAVFEQLPRGQGKAISDGPFEFANNHGRLFGPYRWAGGWLFTGAFSRETADLVTKVKHHYASFDQARDAFAWALDGGGRYEVSGFVPLGNALLGSPLLCSGDHDGLAAYLVAKP